MMSEPEMKVFWLTYMSKTLLMLKMTITIHPKILLLIIKLLKQIS